MPITAGHLGAGIHAAGLSAAISSAAAAGLVGENKHNLTPYCMHSLLTMILFPIINSLSIRTII